MWRHSQLFELILFQSDEEDVSQFDQRFTKETPIDSPCDHYLSESVDRIFQVRLTVHVELESHEFRFYEMHYLDITWSAIL